LNQLHYYDLNTKEDRIMVNDPGRSLQKIPGEERMSFIEKNKTDKWLLNAFDNATGKVSLITLLPKGEDIAWTKNGSLLLSEDDHILVYDRKQNNWSRAVISGD